MIVNMETLNWG